jgi:hypothetical protein
MIESKRTVMKYDGKEFTVIPGCSKYYICKDTEEVLSINKNYPYIMKPAINSTTGYSTYFMVRVVTDEGKTVKKYIHRLMAETFVANPYNKKQVNHIDGDKHNNSIQYRMDISPRKWSTRLRYWTTENCRSVSAHFR